MNPASAPAPSLRYLSRLTDEVGVVEHARLDRPRLGEGYCTDDAGRLLGLASTLADDPAAERLAQACLGFLERAHVSDGHFRLRQGGDGRWTDDPPSDDAAGRALVGLGAAVARAPWPEVRRRAQRLFDQASNLESPYPRAVAYAAIGAAHVVEAQPTHSGARTLLRRASEILDDHPGGETWPWREPRLSYANALLPEAALAAAMVASDPLRATRALDQLWWLVRRQTLDGHFSFVPTGGADAGFTPPQFDQQPIEAWALAEACARAFRYSGDPRWAREVHRAAAWFLGDNDVGVAMFDGDSGGGFDGLEAGGVNANQGAESSMAFVATMWISRDVESRWSADERV